MCVQMVVTRYTKLKERRSAGGTSKHIAQQPEAINNANMGVQQFPFCPVWKQVAIHPPMCSEYDLQQLLDTVLTFVAGAQHRDSEGLSCSKSRSGCTFRRPHDQSLMGGTLPSPKTNAKCIFCFFKTMLTAKIAHTCFICPVPQRTLT